MPIEVDAVVVGLGPGGEDVAGRLAEAGLDTVGVEQRLVGGECPYWGCIPSKIAVRAADLIAEGHRIPGMAGTAMVRPDWRPVTRRITEATADWDDKRAVDRLTAKGTRFLRGTGYLSGPGEITVQRTSGEETVLRPRRAIVLAVGTEPVPPPIPGLPGTPYWTNRDALEATELPKSLLVLGGGTVGVELGQAFSRFGSTVTIVEGGQRLLAREEPEVHELLLRVLTADGVTVRTGIDVVRVTYDGDEFGLHGVRGDRLTARRLLVATGRRADLSSLGVGVLGIDPGVAALPVDERMRVVAPADDTPGVWALGDVTGKGAFTHMSMYQGELVIADVLGRNGPPASYHAVPRVTFTDPEIGAVGLTEGQARERGIPVLVGHTDLAATARGFIHHVGNEGFLKVIADGQRSVLVGATAAGPTGGEVLGALTLAVHAKVPLSELNQVIWAYPTFHRAIGEALRDLRPG